MLNKKILLFCVGFCLLICTSHCSEESRKIKAMNTEIRNYLEKLSGNWEFQYRISKPSGRGNNFYSGGDISFPSHAKGYSLKFDIEYQVNFQTYSYAVELDIGYDKPAKSWMLDMSCVNWPSFENMPLVLTDDGIYGEVTSKWEAEDHTFTLKLKRLENNRWVVHLWGFMGNAAPVESIKIVLAPKIDKAYEFLQLLNESIDAENVVTLPKKYINLSEIKTTAQLTDSQGNLFGEGKVEYFFNGWKDFGTMVNGVAAKELLPGAYSFRLNYDGRELYNKQDISENNIVEFSTISVTVKVMDSQGDPFDKGVVTYYTNYRDKDFGRTVNGVANKELLPGKYPFTFNYNGKEFIKRQDISENNIVEIIINTKEFNGD